MNERIKADNRTAQLHYRGLGNPVSVLPKTAISNCFPGLEFDFRNLWRRAFEGIVLMESNNFVVAAEDSTCEDLVTRRLLRVEGFDTMVVTRGRVRPGEDDGQPGRLASNGNPNGVSFMEWSNSLARLWDKQGKEVDCWFSEARPANQEALFDPVHSIKRRLKMRRFFDGNTAAIARDLLQPGELSQSLCSPWQNDYRECACYYWAASRPDYVNVEAGPDGVSRGDTWMAKTHGTGNYIPDDRQDTRLLSYDDLFENWQTLLSFIIRGRDSDVSP